MICSIHQPHFFPWLGYFNKVMNSNVFVWLHSVQYRKNYFQNRTRIKNNKDQPEWLTLPVHAHLGMAIDEILIGNPNWRTTIEKTILQNYQKTPFFNLCWPSIYGALESASELLEDVNYLTFKSILELMEVNNVQITKVNDLAIQETDPTLRLVKICELLGAKTYIAGKGGREYMKLDCFNSAGIKVIWQNFIPEKVVYQQQGRIFIPGLSVIDCLFNVGPERTRDLITTSWSPFEN